MTMSRSISWRRLCPESVSTKVDEALAATFYILHQTGPTAFILKEEGSSRKIKVTNNRSSITCIVCRIGPAILVSI